MCSYLSLFFFYYYCAHRNLHSFPTRRSSDLMEHISENEKIVVGLDIGTTKVCAVRSEEHTSELQSRGHLVCRLLLEKKKKQRNHKRIRDQAQLQGQVVQKVQLADSHRHVSQT